MHSNAKNHGHKCKKVTLCALVGIVIILLELELVFVPGTMGFQFREIKRVN